MAPRGRPRKKASEKQETSSLLKAVAFCGLADNENQEVYTQHMVFIHGFAYRFDGILAAGYPCTDEISVSPRYENFAAALKRVGNDFEILVGEENMIVKGGRLRANVPVLDASVYPALPPDPARVSVDDETFRQHMGRINRIASDTSSHVITASILLADGLASATDRHLLMQTRVGIWTDRPLCIPKAALSSVLKSGEKLVGMGWGESSVTFWFESGAFIRSQLYNEEWPDVNKFLPTIVEDHEPLPKDFFEAIETILAVAETDDLMLDARGVSDKEPDTPTASVYELKETEKLSGKISGKRMMLLRDLVETACFEEEDKVTFFGPDFRASLQKRR